MVRGSKHPKRAKHRGLFAEIIRSLLIRFVVWVFALTLLTGVAGFLWIDHNVQQKFGKLLWDIPLHVYSRTFEIYPGLAITAEQMEDRLLGLGYRRQQNARRVGEYAINRGTVDFVTREFLFWDGPQSSIAVRMEVENGLVRTLQDRKTGKSLSLMRLTPELIGTLYQAQHEDRYLMRLEDIPKLLLATLIAVEDRKFLTHIGIDFKAILRAAWVNWRAGRIVQGGSTLTQQLVKNVYGRDDQTYARKLLEMATAVVLEFRLEKKRIIEAYCNEVFLGQDGKRAIHGFGLGSKFLFGRPLSELNPNEIAQLVGMIKAPTSYNPRRNPQRAKDRRAVVLGIMKADNLISESEYARHINSELQLQNKPYGNHREFASYVDIVLTNLSSRLNSNQLKGGGLSVFTTMDLEIQRAAEKAMSEELSQIERQKNIKSGTLEGAVVVIRPDDGEVLAVVGSRKSYIGNFNRAIEARRPIGSLIKPFIYLTAFMEGRDWSLSSIVDDEPVRFKFKGNDDWEPGNFDDKFVGEITVLDALAQSRNIPAVKVGMDIGVKKVAGILRKMGVEVPLPVYPSMLLGTLEMSPMEVAELYQALSNYGYQASPKFIAAISDDSGSIDNARALKVEATVPTDVAYLTLFGMQEVVMSGTAKSLVSNFDRKLRLAGKTGTTDDYRDSWFVGISGNLLAVVWVGRDDNRSTGLTGASGAMQVWRNLMKSINLQVLSLTPGDGIEFVDIDMDSGYKAVKQCKRIRRVPFLLDTAPRRFASCHG